MREVPVYGWPKPFRPSHLHWGPQGDELCPCGSRRRARSCHLAPDGWWLTPSAPPLLGDERTGYRHPGCYASTSSDCSSRLSREHWLSASVLNAFAPIGLRGMVPDDYVFTVVACPCSGCKGGPDSLPAAALSAVGGSGSELPPDFPLPHEHCERGPCPCHLDPPRPGTS
jgi:hypothetical protein